MFDLNSLSSISEKKFKIESVIIMHFVKKKKEYVFWEIAIWLKESFFCLFEICKSVSVKNVATVTF